MSTGLRLDYHYGSEADQYTFYRLPKALFTNDRYKKLSAEAKIVYGLMLDRMSLSAKNGWMDKDDRVYIFFTLEDVQEYINCKHEKAVRLLAELDMDKGVGLIERIKQGQGKPSIIYVRKFIEAAEVKTSEKQKSKLPNRKRSRLLKNGSLDLRKTEGNNTDLKETKYNDTESIIPSVSPFVGGTEGIDFERYRFYEQIEYHRLYEECSDKERLDELIDLLADIFQSTKRTLRVNGEDKPTQAVQEQLMRLGPEHIVYVLDLMSENTAKVRNMRNYLLTALYNATMVVGHSVANRVQHDLYGEG